MVKCKGTPKKNLDRVMIFLFSTPSFCPRVITSCCVEILHWMSTSTIKRWWHDNLKSTLTLFNKFKIINITIFSFFINKKIEMSASS